MGFLFGRKPLSTAPKTDTYQCKFCIKSNTLPAPADYDQLNEAEQRFFCEFERDLGAAKLSPYDITLTRLKTGMLNVNHSSGYIGKINLRTKKNGDFYMQYLGSRGAVKEISTTILDDCISSIPFWVQSINRYQNARKRALRI